VELLARPFVETAPAESVEVLEELVRPSPRADVSGDAAPRTDLEYLGRGADHPQQERARR
jgi:hypothetical protein